MRPQRPRRTRQDRWSVRRAGRWGDVGAGTCQLGGVSLWRSACAECPPHTDVALASGAQWWPTHFDETALRPGPVHERHAGHQKAPIEASDGHQQRTPSQQLMGRQHNEPQHVVTDQFGTLGGKCALDQQCDAVEGGGLGKKAGYDGEHDGYHQLGTAPRNGSQQDNGIGCLTDLAVAMGSKERGGDMTMAKVLHAELDGDQRHLGDAGSLVHLVDHQLACTSRRSKSRSTATANANAARVPARCGAVLWERASAGERTPAWKTAKFGMLCLW